jgi:hypothetical protein
MSNILLEHLIELSVISKVSDLGYQFEMSKFLCLGSMSACSEGVGLYIKGNVDGCDINGISWKCGAITSVIVSEYLEERFGWNAQSALPVGFDNSRVQGMGGKIAAQFKEWNSESKTLAQNDPEVVQKFLGHTYATANYKDEAALWDIPAVSAKKILTVKKRTIDLDYTKVPSKFYIRAEGSEDDIEILLDIAKDENYSVCRDEGQLYFTNIDCTDVPPRSIHMAVAVLDFPEATGTTKQKKDAHSHGNRCDESVEEDQEHRVDAEATDGEEQPDEDEDHIHQLPVEWDLLLKLRTIKSYHAAVACADLAQCVSSMKIRLGTNRNKPSKQLLAEWAFNEKKTVGEFLDLCEVHGGEGPRQAKMFLSILTHVRVKGDHLVRPGPTSSGRVQR